ncbi:MAG: hypothetical protein E7601_05865 [Ruminococcaceae bacterium]|nr:hypothetical protein [Oscillospiraceae bacterium]
MKKYKLNNSYITYVIDECNIEDQPASEDQYYPKKERLEWRKGANVIHWSYGQGEITNITDNQITVRFSNSQKKIFCPQSVTFDAKMVKNDSLKLC